MLKEGVRSLTERTFRQENNQNITEHFQAAIQGFSNASKYLGLLIPHMFNPGITFGVKSQEKKVNLPSKEEHIDELPSKTPGVEVPSKTPKIARKEPEAATDPIKVEKKEPVIPAAPIKTEKKVIPQAAFLKDIQGKNIYLTTIWKTFLGKFGKDIVSAWSCDKDTGAFSLELHKPLALWTDANALGIPSEGGVVFSLDPKIEGSFQEGKMTFSKGFNVTVNAPLPWWLGGRKIMEASVQAMEITGPNTMEITGKLGLVKQSTPFPISTLLQSWHSRSEIVRGDLGKHILSKIA